MVPIHPRRAPFYSLALISALWQMTVAPITAETPGKSPYLYAVGALSGSVAALTWIWIAVLLAHSNSKETWERPLARSYAHIISFSAIAVVWLGMGILVLTQTTIECAQKTKRCNPAMFVVALAFLTSLFAGLCAAIVYNAAVASKAGFSCHVAQARYLAIANDEIVV